MVKSDCDDMQHAATKGRADTLVNTWNVTTGKKMIVQWLMNVEAWT